MIACVDSDAENIFITLTARELRADIAIVARASVEDSEKKLKRAGADRVDLALQGERREMARLALHPQVTGVVDVAPEYRMEEIEVTAGCRGEGKTIGDVRGGSVIVALRRRRHLPGPAAGRDGARRGRRDHGDGHAAHDGAPRGAVRARRGGARVVTPLGELRAAVAGAPRRHCAPAAAAGHRPPTLERPASPSSATTRPTPRCCSRRCSGSRRARSPSGWRRRWPSGSATGSTGSRSPGRASSTCSSPTPGTATRCAACWTPATNTGVRRRARRPSASSSSSSRPTRPAR